MVKIDMEMPKSCKECPFKMQTSDDSEFICRVFWVKITHYEQDKSRCAICPLKECE